MASLRTILLDVDGTLVDSNDLHAEAWCEALRDSGRDVPFARVRRLIGMGGDKVVPLLTGLADDSAEGKALSEHRSRVFMTRYLPRVEPFACVRELLVRMRGDGYRLVVASSAKEEELAGLLTRAGVKDLIDDETTADDAERTKPDPDIVRAALSKANASPPEAVLLGDTPYDVQSAQRAGVASIGVRSGGYQDAALKGAIAVYEDVRDLLARYADSPLGRAANAGPGARTRH